MPLASAIDNSGYIFYAVLAHKDSSFKPLDLIKLPEAKTARCRFIIDEESVKADLTFTQPRFLLILETFHQLETEREKNK